MVTLAPTRATLYTVIPISARSYSPINVLPSIACSSLRASSGDFDNVGCTIARRRSVSSIPAIRKINTDDLGPTIQLGKVLTQRGSTLKNESDIRLVDLMR
jgi:hypothetical protein